MLICLGDHFTGLLRQKHIKKKEKQGWLIQAETQIEAIRKHLSRIDVVLKCKEKNQFTKKQKNIEKQLKNVLENNQGKSLGQTNATKTRTKKQTERVR